MKEQQHPVNSIWILEDDEGCQFVYEEILGSRYRLKFFANLAGFAAALDGQNAGPDLVIADVRLPDDSLHNFFRSQHAQLLLNLPFVVVSSVDDAEMLRECFERGARDYLTKPFGKAELLFKIDRILVGASAEEPHPWTLESASLTLKREGRRTEMLTSKEFQILSILMLAPNYTLPREEIIERVWSSVRVSPKTLDVHLSKLRRKIAPLHVGIEFRPPNFYLIVDLRNSPLGEGSMPSDG